VRIYLRYRRDFAVRIVAFRSQVHFGKSP